MWEYHDGEMLCSRCASLVSLRVSFKDIIEQKAKINPISTFFCLPKNVKGHLMELKAAIPEFIMKWTLLVVLQTHSNLS